MPGRYPVPLWILGLAGVLVSPAFASAPASQAGFGVERELKLPAAVRQVRDVRWGEDGSLLLARFVEGTMELSADSGAGETLLPGGNGFEPRMHWSLGFSAGRLAVASPVYELVLREPDGSVTQGPFFEHIDDLDLWRERLAILGSRRNDDRVPAPEIAWLIDLEGEAEELPLLRSVDSPKGPWPIDSCGAFGMGAVRFLPSGELVVVPGVEPDVYLFRPDGRLVRTWPTAPLNIAGECDLERAQVEHLSRDEEARWRWLNRRRTVDDVVPLPGGEVGLVVRDPTAGAGVRWDLVRLRRDGATSSVRLPFVADTDRAFLRADVRGGKAVVLIGQWWSKDTAVDVAPRLLVGRFAIPPR